MTYMTFDRRTTDSAGSFLVRELERLDPTLHEPLSAVTWSRDIDLREDVCIADEAAGFINSAFGAVGGLAPTGKAWIGTDTTSVSGITLENGKTSQPLFLWGMEIGYTLPELESARRLGRPIDQQKFAAMRLKYQMDVDEMVYIGDTALGIKGLLNSPAVASTQVVPGAKGSTTWVTKTPDEILADINALLSTTWERSAWAVCPDRLLLPPVAFAHLAGQKVGEAGSVSILEFIRQNSLSLAINGRALEIQPVKWLSGRVAAYTKDQSRVRYPLVPLQRTAPENHGIHQSVTYYGRLGGVEWVYPETGGYADGI